MSNYLNETCETEELLNKHLLLLNDAKIANAISSDVKMGDFKNVDWNAMYLCITQEQWEVRTDEPLKRNKKRNN